MPILTITDFPSVRSILGVTDVQLPGAVLADPLHLPLAEAWAEGEVPDWVGVLAQDGADATYLRAAASYYLAYLSVGYLSNTLYEREEKKVGAMTTTYQRNRALDWDAVSMKMLHRAWASLGRMTARRLAYQPPSGGLRTAPGGGYQ